MNLNNNAGSVINIDGTAAGRGKLDPRAWANGPGRSLRSKRQNGRLQSWKSPKTARRFSCPLPASSVIKSWALSGWFTFHKAAEKVVCCRPGEQVLFPSATEFCLGKHSPTTKPILKSQQRTGTSGMIFWMARRSARIAGNGTGRKCWLHIPTTRPYQETNIGINAEGTFCYSPEIQILSSPN